MPKVIPDEVVFEAALEVLSAQGYAGATTRLIADAAGVNEATLFRKYGSKPALITRAIETCAFQHEGRVAYSGDLAADLHRAGDAWVDTMRKHGHLFPVIMSEMARHPELRRTAHGPRSLIQEIAAVMLQYQQEGRLKTDEDPLQAVASFLGPLIVISMLQGAAPRIAPSPVDITGHVHRFLHGRC